MLSAAAISFSINQQCLLHPTQLQFEPERFHVIMGANGAGKSTLLKLLAGELRPTSGGIFLNEKLLSSYTKKELAIKRAVLSQHYNIAFPITVKELVLMGRYPYFTSTPSALDFAICNEAMEMMNVYALRERDYNTLSGGEAQKVQMSRVLAQIWQADAGNQKLLFLDEPVSHLDVKYQQQLLKAAKSFCSKYTTVVAILHDLNLALSFADRLLFMKEGKVVYEANQMNDISSAIIEEVFDVKVSILNQNNKPVVIF